MSRTIAEKILAVRAATLELIDGGGIEAVTMTEVAEIAGVSRAWVNTVFADRAHLIAEAICTRTADELCASIDGLTDFVRTAPSAALVGDHLAALAIEMNRPEVVERHWQFLEMVAWTYNDAAVLEPVMWSLRRVHASLESCVSAVDDRGWLRSGIGPVTATMVILAASVAARVEAIGQEPADQSHGGLLSWVISACLDREPDRPSVSDPVRIESSGLEIATSHDDVGVRIVASASIELEANGPDGFNLRPVSSRAEVSWSALYRRFPDRRALLEDAGQEMLGRVQIDSVEQTRAAVGGSEDPVTTLVASIAAFTREHDRAFFIALAAARQSPAAGARMAQQAVRFDMHADALRAALGAGSGARIEGLAGVCRVIAFATVLVDALPEVDIAPADLHAVYRLLVERALLDAEP